MITFELGLWLLSRRGYLAHSLQDVSIIPVLNGRSKCSKSKLMTLSRLFEPYCHPHLHRIEATPTQKPPSVKSHLTHILLVHHFSPAHAFHLRVFAKPIIFTQPAFSHLQSTYMFPGPRRKRGSSPHKRSSVLVPASSVGRKFLAHLPGPSINPQRFGSGFCAR